MRINIAFKLKSLKTDLQSSNQSLQSIMSLKSSHIQICDEINNSNSSGDKLLKK